MAGFDFESVARLGVVAERGFCYGLGSGERGGEIW